MTTPTHKLKVVNRRCDRCGNNLDLTCGLCLSSDRCCACKLAPRFVSDAERERLPLVNVHDSGRSPLDVEAVLKRTSVERLIGLK